MLVSLSSGKYVIAVSGGVDSVVLLDLLARQEGVRLTVAHFDHGIREDSGSDRLFVQTLAGKYNVPFVYDAGHLGSKASEARAREARYKFLRRVKQITSAQAIITAHHEDDVLETAILNLLRGTDRKGLSSLQGTKEIYRPLLNVPKNTLIDYAQSHGLEWREDSTNANSKYLRNHIRTNILSRFDDASKQRLRDLIDTMRLTNAEIDSLLADQLFLQPSSDTLGRHWFIMLPHAVAREIMAAWLRTNGAAGFNKRTIERIVAMAKVLPANKRIDIDSSRIIIVKSDKLALLQRDR